MEWVQNRTLIVDLSMINEDHLGIRMEVFHDYKISKSILYFVYVAYTKRMHFPQLYLSIQQIL